MAASAYCYVLAGPDIPTANSLGKNLIIKIVTQRSILTFKAFKMADSGYDVWLMNCRPTLFTRHKKIPRSSPRYWQFSFHEIARHDIPASIDYVLMTTNHTFVHYVGHSQGTTSVMAMLSMLPEYNKKIKTLHLMAPAVYFGHAGPVFKSFATILEPLKVRDYP